MITRIALYATLGCLLDALQQPWDTWGFWAVLGLFMASEHLTRVETYEHIEAEVQRLRAEHNKDKQ